MEKDKPPKSTSALHTYANEHIPHNVYISHMYAPKFQSKISDLNSIMLLFNIPLSFFSHGHHKGTQGERLTSAHWSRLFVGSHHRSANRAGAGNHGLHTSTQRAMNDYYRSAPVLPFIQSRITTQGMVPPTVGRSSHLNYLINITPYRHPQRLT